MRDRTNAIILMNKIFRGTTMRMQFVLPLLLCLGFVGCQKKSSKVETVEQYSYEYKSESVTSSSMLVETSYQSLHEKILNTEVITKSLLQYTNLSDVSIENFKSDDGEQSGTKIRGEVNAREININVVSKKNVVEVNGFYNDKNIDFNIVIEKNVITLNGFIDDNNYNVSIEENKLNAKAMGTSRDINMSFNISHQGTLGSIDGNRGDLKIKKSQLTIDEIDQIIVDQIIPKIM